jgi:hypothetical protein
MNDSSCAKARHGGTVLHRRAAARPSGFADTVVTASVVILVLAILICAAALLPILWTAFSGNNPGSGDMRGSTGESGRSCPTRVPVELDRPSCTGRSAHVDRIQR